MYINNIHIKNIRGLISDAEMQERKAIMEALPRKGGEVQRLLRKFSEV